MTIVDIYDFDGTIYRGDSTVDFIRFLLGKRKSLALSLLACVPDAVRLLFDKNLTTFKSSLFSRLSGHVDLNAEGRAFWETTAAQDKINEWIRQRKRDVPTIIASASPDFELKWIARQLDADLVCTNCDPKTGRVIGVNCKSSEKVRKIREKYGEVSVRAMYTDNTSADRPLLELAEEQYRVDPKTGAVSRIQISAT